MPPCFRVLLGPAEVGNSGLDCMRGFAEEATVHRNHRDLQAAGAQVDPQKCLDGHLLPMARPGCLRGFASRTEAKRCTFMAEEDRISQPAMAWRGLRAPC